MRTTPVVIEKFGTMHYLTGYVSAIEDNELRDAVNVIIDEQGVISRRAGFDQVQAITGPGNNAFIISRHNTGASDTILVASPVTGVSLVQGTGSSTVWTEATLTSAKAAVQYDYNTYIFSYQTQQIMKLDSFGSRTANWANVQASGAIAHKSRIFTWNLYTGLIDRIRYSQLYTDPTNPNFQGAGAWPAANTIDVSPGDGEPIVAVVEYNDNLIIFKKTSTWILYTDGSPLTGWKLQKLNDNIGCVNVHSPKVIGSLLYFQGVDGVFRTDGTTFEEISRPISNVWTAYDHGNNTVLFNRSAVEWNGLYIIQPDWEDTDWYLFNTRNDTWTRWETPVPFSNMVVFEESTSRPLRMMRFGITSAQFWETNEFSSFQDGENPHFTPTPYQSQVVLKRQDFGQPDQWKYIPQVAIAFSRHLALTSETTTVQVNSVIDANNGVSLPSIQSLQTDSSEFDHIYRFKGPGRCRYLQLLIYTSAQTDMAITKIIFHMVKSKGAVGYAHGN